MAQIKLTVGAIPMLSTGKWKEEEFTPVLQITDIRSCLIQNQRSNNNERYTILLSDGQYLQHGILAKHNSHLIWSQRMKKGTIIYMKEFVPTFIQNRTIIIIIELDILLELCDQIGEPKHYLKTDGSTELCRQAMVPQLPRVDMEKEALVTCDILRTQDEENPARKKSKMSTTVATSPAFEVTDLDGSASERTDTHATTSAGPTSSIPSTVRATSRATPVLSKAGILKLGQLAASTDTRVVGLEKSIPEMIRMALAPLSTSLSAVPQKQQAHETALVLLTDRVARLEERGGGSDLTSIRADVTKLQREVEHLMSAKIDFLIADPPQEEVPNQHDDRDPIIEERR
ncbi:uncharacterized protein LOC132615522 isoform X1 [Lycium barbarum]|uniref:uncharacterized protein LOC132615522 isoform X1 n=1 Tax=Lycium barbarum TaxID=112863 RepID=UPI00293EFE19|nr:uncharacterized protein LOC132615522 isoform X1 [Lycium barbarum]